MVKCVIGGVPLSGFGDNIIEIEYDEDAYTEKVGTDGRTARIRNLNENGTATITLQQTSPSNDVLSTLANKDRVDGTGVVPFLVMDLSGRTIVTAAQCYIKKQSKVAIGKELKETSWVIKLVSMKLFVGGNS
jgi:hypothetical protein